MSKITNNVFLYKCVSYIQRIVVFLKNRNPLGFSYFLEFLYPCNQSNLVDLFFHFEPKTRTTSKSNSHGTQHISCQFIKLLTAL